MAEDSAFVKAAIRLEMENDQLKAKLGESATLVESFSERLTRKAKDITKGWTDITSAFNAVKAAVEVVYNKFKEFVDAAAAAEAANIKLASALANQGISYREVKGELDKYFQSIEKTTRFSGGEASDVFRKLIDSNIEYGDALKLTGRILDLSVAKDKDIMSVTQAVTAAYNGVGSAAKIIGVEMSNTGTAQDRFNDIMEKTSNFTGRAAEVGKTFTDQMTSLKNQAGETDGKLGQNFLPTLLALRKSFTDLYTNSTVLQAAFKVLGDVFALIAYPVVGFITAMRVLDTIVKTVGETFGLLVSEIVMFSKGDFTGVIAAGKELTKVWVKGGEEISAAITSADQLFTLINNGSEVQIKAIDDRKTKHVQTSEEILKLETELNQKILQLNSDTLEGKIKLLEEEVKKYEDAGANKDLIDKFFKQAKEKLEAEDKKKKDEEALKKKEADEKALYGFTQKEKDEYDTRKMNMITFRDDGKITDQDYSDFLIREGVRVKDEEAVMAQERKAINLELYRSLQTGVGAALKDLFTGTKSFSEATTGLFESLAVSAGSAFGKIAATATSALGPLSGILGGLIEGAFGGIASLINGIFNQSDSKADEAIKKTKMLADEEEKRAQAESARASAAITAKAAESKKDLDVLQKTLTLATSKPGPAAVTGLEQLFGVARQVGFPTEELSNLLGRGAGNVTMEDLSPALKNLARTFNVNLGSQSADTSDRDKALSYLRRAFDRPDEAGLTISDEEIFKRVRDRIGGLQYDIDLSKYFSGGGSVGSGFGGGDRVPIMAEEGEFMVNKWSSRAFRPVLEAINSVGRKGYQWGGSIDAPGRNVSLSVQFNAMDAQSMTPKWQSEFKRWVSEAVLGEQIGRGI